MKYIVKPTKKQLAQIKKFFKAEKEVISEMWSQTDELEKHMERATGIKGIEFFWVDNCIVGVGNFPRTMKLLQEHELE